MNIIDATQKYETWLRHRTTLVSTDLKLKHRFMAASPFPFLRATFYRWLQIWEKVCPEASSAPHVLAVGDLHIENFGTWRDDDGRLAWGINDFDEVSHMPYTIDLVRLTSSALLAQECDHFAIKPRKIAAQILAGYTDAIASGGRPFVLSSSHGWLRKIALTSIREGAYFWLALSRLKQLDKHQVPAAARAAIERLMPEKDLDYGYARRSAGLGSRGHQRFVAVANWRGGEIAREAKALVPATSVWLRGEQGGGPILYSNILRRAVRVPDPCFRVDGKWVVRRLSPSCRKINIAALPSEKYEKRLLYSMGWETANVHLGTPHAIPLVGADLKTRRGPWLLDAATLMVRAVRRDWKDWRD
jgi:hypothetical protein